MNSKKFSPDSKAGVVEVASLDDIYNELKQKKQYKVKVPEHRVTRRTTTREKDKEKAMSIRLIARKSYKRMG